MQDVIYILDFLRLIFVKCWNLMLSNWLTSIVLICVVVSLVIDLIMSIHKSDNK